MPQQIFAHQIQIDRGVGATKHIEPNDTPRSGEPTRIWFALTRRGGQVIPLDHCDCTVAVYAQPRQADSPPITLPTLEPYSAEGYTDIPAATVTFPQVGAYELVLSGTPQAGIEEAAQFEPFQLNFDVTVAQGTTVPVPELATPPTTASASNLSSNSPANLSPGPSPGIPSTASPGEIPAETPTENANNRQILTDVVVEPVVVPPEDVTVPVGIGAIVIVGLGIAFYGWRSGWGAKKD
ncbi:MAG: hypothetical protein ACO4AI_03060 [Prochlorothrix sp.]|nr:hypothetical protein [Prochlorothrix sp.]